jgi:hypothetical protein
VIKGATVVVTASTAASVVVTTGVVMVVTACMGTGVVAVAGTVVVSPQAPSCNTKTG